MHSEIYKYLNFTTFKDLVLWSAAGIISQGIKYNKKYKLVPISSFLRKSSHTIIIENDVIYTRLTIKTNNGGIVIRDQKRGSDIGTKKQNVVCGGQFLVSKIDARNGAFGIIPEELNGAIVTNDFPVFDINETIINPTFLLLVTTTKAFVKFAQSCSSGTTNRQRIDINQFLSQKIPLPSLKEQVRIVSKYKDKIKEAEGEELKTFQIELGIEDFLKDTLGATTQQDKKEQGNKYKYLKIVNFQNVFEWGIDIIQKKQKRETFKYPIVKIKDLCQLGSGGTPSRSCPQYYNGTIPWVKTGEVFNEEIFETEEHITEEAIANSSARLYPKGSLIIAMYGQGDTRGRTAKLGIDATTNQACAVLHDIDNNIVSTDYLWYYLQGRYDDLRSMASGNSQPNLNAGKINNYDVVVPPMDVQNEMVAHIKEQKALVKQLRQKATSIREDALKEFENEIFE